nr:MAG TPA: hypothetical protein [Caudoviricetes sp.]
MGYKSGERVSKLAGVTWGACNAKPHPLAR